MHLFCNTVCCNLQTSFKCALIYFFSYCLPTETTASSVQKIHGHAHICRGDDVCMAILGTLKPLGMFWIVHDT